MLPEREEELTTEQLTAPQERVPFWGYTDLFLVIGLTVPAVLILFGVIALAVLIWPELHSDQTPIALPIQILLYLLLYLIFRAVLTGRYGKPVFASLGWVPTQFRSWHAVVGGLTLAPVIALLLVALRTPKIHSPMEDMLKSTPLLIGFGIIAVTVAPLFEEMVFRGFLQPLLVRSLGAVAGILIPSVLFGCLHLAEYSNAWQSAVAISLVGLALGWVRYQSGSIIPSTLMHCAYNGVLIAVAVAAKFNPKLAD
jgi:uncharacterized protein